MLQDNRQIIAFNCMYPEEFNTVVLGLCETSNLNSFDSTPSLFPRSCILRFLFFFLRVIITPRTKKRRTRCVLKSRKAQRIFHWRYEKTCYLFSFALCKYVCINFQPTIVISSEIRSDLKKLHTTFFRDLNL